MAATWANRARANEPLDLTQAGVRVFSQFEEDGLLVAIFAAIGTTKQLFVDIGAADGVNSNCANLAINFGWHGLFIDGDERQIAHGRSWYASHPDTFLFPPKFVAGMVTRENVNALIRDAGFIGEIDFLAIDIDGNDYWVWEALDTVTARVVMIESNAAFGDQPIVVPYDPNFTYVGDYFGAGPAALCRLAERKGYRLVGSNRFGFNLVFVRNGLGEQVFPEVSLGQVRQHVRNLEVEQLFQAIRERNFVAIPDLKNSG